MADTDTLCISTVTQLLSRLSLLLPDPKPGDVSQKLPFDTNTL